MATSPRLLPDLDDELAFALGQIEELLLTLRSWEEDPDDPAQLPAPLADGVALDALRQLWDAIVPTQSRHHRPAVPGRLLGPDGRYEHRPLRLVLVDDTDLQTLGAAGQALGHALATAPGGELAEAVAAGAEAADPTYGPAPTPVALVELMARVHGVLDLADTTDTALLRDRLRSFTGGRCVIGSHIGGQLAVGVIAGATARLCRKPAGPPAGRGARSLLTGHRGRHRRVPAI